MQPRGRRSVLCAHRRAKPVSACVQRLRERRYNECHHGYRPSAPSGTNSARSRPVTGRPQRNPGSGLTVATAPRRAGLNARSLHNPCANSVPNRSQRRQGRRRNASKLHSAASGRHGNPCSTAQAAGAIVPQARRPAQPPPAARQTKGHAAVASNSIPPERSAGSFRACVTPQSTLTGQSANALARDWGNLAINRPPSFFPP